ncbi:hypothetical protein BK004_03125 [bacterium CG10_46_32]|nr:MAG: hypothetical protein BK004_03125 [bacterium CG10_46_32]PIR55992.1 MAG: hypothetical protein COU73_03160 [Parcubacteria group bacterium CG10_big_fil_rev_8_21_14_0_10_46_32]
MPWRKLVIILFLLPFLGASCTELLVTNGKDAAEQVLSSGSQLIRQAGNGFARGLTPEQKVAIDDWLSANNLNDFGDKEGTFYTGGTPLFDERTGETIDRFQYLFDKFPELRDVVKEQIKKQPSE